MGMSIPYETTGRTRQKARTRAAMLAATSELLGEGVTPTVERMARQFVDHEPELRAMLRLSLEVPAPEKQALPLRQGRAIGWIEEALSPLGDQLSDQARRQVVRAIRSVVGIEALAWLTDVARLSREDAVGLMRWSAQALLRSALTGRPPDVTGCTHGGPGET